MAIIDLILLIGRINSIKYKKDTFSEFMETVKMERRFGIVAFVVLCLAWQAKAAVNCTSTGAGRFAEPTDTTCQNYTMCVAQTNGSYASYNYVCPSTSLFNPATSLCTKNYVCNVTTSVCTTEGFIADPSSTNCSSYINCVEINGTFTEEGISCPSGTLYNPNTTLCETNYTCTTSNNSTSNSTTFSCTGAGRFANTSDTTCKTYYLCVLATNGTYVNYEYTCPTTSVFSASSQLCTTTYICPTS